MLIAIQSFFLCNVPFINSSIKVIKPIFIYSCDIISSSFLSCTFMDAIIYLIIGATIYIYVCVCMNVCTYQSLWVGRMWHKFNFKAKFNRFNFRFFRFLYWRCPWCNGYRRRKHEFKSWRLIAFQIALIPLGKVWIQLFFLQLWVNSRADLVLQSWWGN